MASKILKFAFEMLVLRLKRPLVLAFKFFASNMLDFFIIKPNNFALKCFFLAFEMPFFGFKIEKFIYEIEPRAVFANLF